MSSKIRVAILTGGENKVCTLGSCLDYFYLLVTIIETNKSSQF